MRLLLVAVLVALTACGTVAEPTVRPTPDRGDGPAPVFTAALALVPTSPRVGQPFDVHLALTNAAPSIDPDAGSGRYDVLVEWLLRGVTLTETITATGRPDLAPGARTDVGSRIALSVAGEYVVRIVVTPEDPARARTVLPDHRVVINP